MIQKFTETQHLAAPPPHTPAPPVLKKLGLLAKHLAVGVLVAPRKNEKGTHNRIDSFFLRHMLILCYIMRPLLILQSQAPRVLDTATFGHTTQPSRLRFPPREPVLLINPATTLLA